MTNHQKIGDKIVLGLTEHVIFKGDSESSLSKTVLSRIDTGATKSSIDATLARELGLNNVYKTKNIRSALGTHKRPFIRITVEIAGRTINGEFSIANRQELKYHALIGQDILKKGFLIDPSKI